MQTEKLTLQKVHDLLSEEWKRLDQLVTDLLLKEEKVYGENDIKYDSLTSAKSAVDTALERLEDVMDFVKRLK